MIENGWYKCPHCGKPLFKVDKDAHCKGVYIKCSGKHKDGCKCREIIAVNFKEMNHESNPI